MSDQGLRVNSPCVLTPGTRLGGYEVLGKIGEGGMGEVYRARDRQLDRDVALKILPEALAADTDRLARFEREAKALASLNHPNIAQIYGVQGGPADHDRQGDGGRAAGPYQKAIVMELVEGETLADLIARRAATRTTDIDESLDIARQIADALEAAHSAGIVHRDLKPANVKVRSDGTVKVLDFGLAKDVTLGPGDIGASPTFTSPAMTAAGMILGTAAYMAPEQARGKPVDKRADIWAFGAVLYEMLTGRSPFAGETVTDVIAAVVKNDPDWTALPSNTPPGIRRLLARCLQKDPRARLRDIGDARLEILDRDSIGTTGTPVPPRRIAPWIALTALLALVAGGTAGALWPRPAAPAPRWTGVLMGGPGSILQPVLSPDGQMLAFQTIVDGQSQIGVMNQDASAWRVLTSDRTRGLTLLHDWSTDGSRIFYDRWTDTLNGVFAVPALGGDERLVLENAAAPVTMPNGDLLVQRINADRQPQLHRFSPSTGRIDPLPALPDSIVSDDVVLPSADGRYVYFYGQPLDDRSSPSAFYRLDLQTGRNEPLSRDLNVRPPVSFALDRKTGEVYVGGTEGDAFQIVRIPASPERSAEAVLSVPDTARFELDQRGGLYVAIRARRPELFAFPISAGTSRTPQRLETLAMTNNREIQVLAPLPDGRLLVGSRAADRDRLLVMQAGKQAYPLIEGQEETRPPATAVGAGRAAVMIGPRSTPDIAIVNLADGRLERRFKAPMPTIATLAASADGRTLFYAAAGSIWALSSEGGTPTRLGAGDSLTVDPDRGDLIVKLDESTRIRLVRMKTTGGAVEEIPWRSDLRLVQRPLVPGAIRGGQLLVAVASADSWFYHAATLDLKTGVVTTLADPNPSDFHFATWRADGVPVSFGYGIDTALWRFTPRNHR